MAGASGARPEHLCGKRRAIQAMGSTHAAETTRRGITEAALEHAPRNHVLAVTAGAVGILGMSFLHPELIIAGLIYALTGSPMLVALVTIINKAGGLGPQLLASSFLEHRARKMPYFVLITWLRALAYAGLLASLWLLTRQVDAASLTLFFAAYLGTCILGGTGHITYMHMIGGMIPADRIGSFFGARNALGNILAIAAGLLVIQPVLGGLDLPVNYLLLAAIGAVLMITNMSMFTRCREVDGPRADKRTSLAESVRRGFAWVREDHNYRMYLWSRVAFRFNYLGLAFFIPYGTEKLRGMDGGSLAILGGIMVATMQVSRVITAALWGRIADRRGFRACLLGGGVFFVIAPALALIAPALPETFRLAIPGASASIDLPLAVYLAALLAVGAAIQGTALGGQHFVVLNAPPHRRPSYLGFANTITSPLTLLPLLGALLMKTAGTSSVFILVLFSALLSIGSAWAMNPVRPRQPEEE